MDTRLKVRLHHVAARIRSLHLGWSLAAVWLLASVCGLVAVALGGTDGSSVAGARIFPWWLGISLALAAFVWIWQLRRQRNLAHVAKRIEERFPSLKQTLITASEVTPNPNGEFGFLQRTLISEAIRHDVAHHWKSLVSGSAITFGWLMNFIGLVGMALVGAAILKLPEQVPALAPLADARSVLSPEMVVEPGNCEVERGSSVIVTARFPPDAMPDEAWLVTTAVGVGNEDASARIAMRRSLADPLYAAYLYDVDVETTYIVEHARARSSEYRIKIFEYPALVRADAALHYPAYASLEDRTIVDTRRITAPVGSRLNWQLHLNKAVASAQLVDPDGTEIELKPQSGDASILETEIDLIESVQWKLRLTDLAGRENTTEYTLRAKVLPNSEPKIKLASGGDLEVSPLQEFEIEANIEDDFAVTATGMSYSFGGEPEVEVAMELDPTAAGSNKKQRFTKMIDMEALGAKPRQLLSYYMWAEDRNNAGELRRVLGDMFFVEVREFEEIFREGEGQGQGQEQGQGQGQGQGNEQTEELLELQKQIMTATWNLMRRSPSKRDETTMRSDLSVILDSQNDALGLLAEKAQQVEIEGAAEIVAAIEDNMQGAVENLGKAFESLRNTDLATASSKEQAAYQGLLALQASEFEVSQSQRSPQSQQSSQRQQRRQQQLDSLELKNDENRYEQEKLAQETQNEEQEQLRQVLSRLRELATRQGDLNQQLRELEAALQAAETEEEKAELESELERLREQQQQLLQDADELQEKMESSSSEAMEETQQEMQDVRDNLQNANEQLRQGNTSQSLSSGSRAEQQLEELQEQVRQQAANRFVETMESMKNDAAELEKRQDEILQQMEDATQPEPGAGLRSDAPAESQVREQIAEQQQKLDELLEQIQQTVEDSEEAEPLLAEKLYDTFRQSQQAKADERLDVTRRLVERNLQPQAQELAEESRQDLSQLRSGIDDAAEAVLGSEVDSLRLALNQLEVATDQLNNELTQANGDEPSSEAGSNAPGSPQNNAMRSDEEDQRPTPGESGAGQPQSPAEGYVESNTQESQDRTGESPGDQPPADGQTASPPNSATQQPGKGQPQSGQPGQEGQPDTPGRPNSPTGSQPDSPPDSPPDSQSEAQASQSEGQPSASSQEPSEQAGAGRSGQTNQSRPATPGLRGDPQQPTANSPGRPGTANAGVSNARPLTGDEFREWSDRLRDVEELVSDPELRWQATEIRQAAREIRKQFKRHSTEPKWSEVEDLVAKPLRELQRRVADELLRKAAEKTEVVPIDRDPVPAEFSRSVQQYYEQLGVGR